MDPFSLYAPFYNAFMKLSGLGRCREAVARLQLHPEHVLLDVGGGTGRVAAEAACACRRVVIADPSAAMTSRVPRIENVEVVRAYAQALPFPAESFDAVICTDALHHIKDIEASIGEIARVLKPGGRVVVLEFHIRGVRGWMFWAFEKVLFGDSRFVTPQELSDMLAKHGIEGTCETFSAIEYFFTGSKRTP